MKTCYYALGGINYKNGVITTCPRQANQLVFANETIMPSQIFNHKNFKELRRMLMGGRWPSGCDTCEEMENVGAKSMRNDYVLDDMNYFSKPTSFDMTKKLYGETKAHEELLLNKVPSSKKLIECYNAKTGFVDNLGLRHVEFRFSTSCNFACLHCSDVYSSGWTKKLKNYVPDEEVKIMDLRQLLGTEHRHGPNDKNEMRLSISQALKIVEDLNENFPLLSQVDFAGGELLYQKQFFPTLKKLSEHPNVSNLHISFHTNFNADFKVDELSEIIKPFKKTSIIISVDAGKTFYSYFRHGGDWSKLKSNIKEFKHLNKGDVNREENRIPMVEQKISMDVSCTTSIYQMLDIYDVFNSFFELECRLDASIVQTPKYLNPSLINLDFHEELKRDLYRTQELINNDKRSEKCDNTQHWFDYIKSYVLKHKSNYKDYNRWLIYRKKSDEIWEQNFNDYFQNYQIEDNELIRVK